MRLDASLALIAEGEEIPFAAEVSLPDTVLMSEAVFYPAPAILTGAYSSIGQSIRVHGHMSFCARSRCVRCLEDARRRLSTAVDVLFALLPDVRNPDLYAYDGAWIDLGDPAADAALLALPMQWLCRDACEGLCPICGTDRNKKQCSCRMEGAKLHPFSALQQLLTKDESEV